jgi:hypothetical protein
MRILSLLILALLISAMAFGQAPVLNSVSPVNIAQPDPGATFTPVTVTLSGRGFKSGMIAYFNGKSVVPRVVNQYQATFVFNATLAAMPGFFPIQVVNKNGWASGTLTMQVCAPVQVVTATLPQGTVGAPYSVQLVAVGGCQ